MFRTLTVNYSSMFFGKSTFSLNDSIREKWNQVTETEIKTPNFAPLDTT